MNERASGRWPTVAPTAGRAQRPRGKSPGITGGQTVPLGSGEGSRSGRAPRNAARTGCQKGP
eukprot:3907403-Pyramimonas_sp.AAC.1